MQDLHIFTQIYFLVQYVVVTALSIVILAMLLRLFFNYRDPNPFGQIGRFAHWLKTQTDSWVRPIANWAANARIDTKLAPVGTILLACLFGYFILRVVGTITESLDGVIISLSNGKFIALIGYLLYGFLGLFWLAVFARVLLSWVNVNRNKIAKFFFVVTDPIILPFRRMLPTIGFIDFSPLVVMILIDLFQTAIRGTLLQ